MGHSASTTIVYVGTARLPQPAVAPAGALALELVVDPAAGRIVGTATNLGMPSLDHLLWEVLVGTEISRPPEVALLEVEVRYCSPLTAAVCKALDAALRRAQQDARQQIGSRASDAMPARLAVGVS
jgi:hypothetical protein